MNEDVLTLENVSLRTDVRTPKPGIHMQDSIEPMDSLILVPLHERKVFLNECVELLNDQWPRSKAARLRSLEQSFEHGEFPISLLMLEDLEGNRRERLIGHSKISPVPYDDEKCFIESVVISKELRGKGYGRRIMEMTEAYAKRKGIKVVHLTTHDQQGFYEKLGYEPCDPIVVFGGCSANIQKLLLQNLEASSSKGVDFEQKTSSGRTSGDVENSAQVIKKNEPITRPSDSMEKASLSTSLANKCSAPAIAPLPPPPPPPVLPNKESENSRIQILYRPDGSPQSAVNGLKMHMRKVLI